MTIARDQFIRGFNALKAAYDRRQRLNAILNEDGSGDYDIGVDPAVRELEQQLVDRCRDHEDENGPWPENSGAEGDISLGLCPLGIMTITDEAGNKLPHLTTAEEIWAKWEQNKTGPFRPMPGSDASSLDETTKQHIRNAIRLERYAGSDAAAHSFERALALLDQRALSLRPITMRDVRLRAGEGPLTPDDVLAAVNAEIRYRAGGQR